MKAAERRRYRLVRRRPEKVGLFFRLSADGAWRLVVPENDELQESVKRLLNAGGFNSFDALEKARHKSPRLVMMRFIIGASIWDTTGREKALATLDLGHVSDSLQANEGTILSDYLKQTLDRIGLIN